MHPGPQQLGTIRYQIKTLNGLRTPGTLVFGVVSIQIQTKMKLSSQVIFRLHEISNLSGILFVEATVGVALWHYISPWWLWLLAFVPTFFIVAFVGQRIFPRITGEIIESLRQDDDQFFTSQGEPAKRFRSPVNTGELFGVTLGLCLFGYATIDSYFTKSTHGFWRDGFFRVYLAEEPFSLWIYRTLCIGGTLVCIWGVIYLLTADRYRIEKDE